MNETTDSSSHTTSVQLTPSPAAPGDARRFIVDVLDCHPVLESAKLVISELVTNAVLHGGHEAGVITVTVSEDAESDVVRLEVSQTNHPGFDFQSAEHGHMEPHHRGLMIVDAVSRDWAIDRSTGAVSVVLG